MNYTEQNISLAKHVIELQKEKVQPKWIFEEIGANTEINHTLQQCSGSSAVIHKALCTYNQEEQCRNPKDNNGKQQWRSVSLEFINAGLDYYKNLNSERYLLKIFNFLRSTLLGNSFHKYKNLNKSIYINSFQTESDTTKVTHGWIGIQNNEVKLLYHITIPDHLDRRTFQEIVGNIGLQLITECLDPAFTITTPYIDQVYDGEQQNIKKTIDLMQKESVVRIDASGKLCRIEDLTRTREGYQPLIIYKGSFNPPHKGHLYMMETIQKKYPNYKALFSISVNNYDKGDVSSHEIIDRIKMINTIGYPVILFGSAYFKDNMDRLRLKNGQEIIFPVGSDTAERIFKTYDDKNKMIDDFAGVRFESFGRELSSFTPDEYPELFHHNHENPYEDVSSTSIRTDVHTHKEKVPPEIHNFILIKHGQNN